MATRCCPRSLLLPQSALLSPVVLALAVIASPFTSNGSITYNGTYLSVQTWHAKNVTIVSWDLTRDGNASAATTADPGDRILIFWDALSTDLERFDGAVNSTNRSSSLSSSSSSFSSSTASSSGAVSTAGYTVFPGDMGAGSDVCDYTAYATDRENAFSSSAMSNVSTVDFGEDSLAWWYTSSLSQELDEEDQDGNAGSGASERGEALVPLTDPGFYIVCLVLGDESCMATECLELAVYQPPYDFMEVRVTTVGMKRPSPSRVAVF